MTVAIGLLALGAVLAVLAPRAIGPDWSARSPRLGVAAWQAASAGTLVSALLAGMTLLVPLTAVSEGLAAILDACASTIAGVYRSPEQLAAVLAGLLLVVGTVLRLTWVAVGSVRHARLERRRLRAAILAGAGPEKVSGALVLDAERPAAFCLPGRRRTVVVTSAALRRLSESELAAVLAHERAHLRGRHHLVVGVARVLRRAFPWVPVFARAEREVERLVEMLADDAAARRVDRVEVASALVSLVGMRAPAAALGAVHGAATLRVARLLAPAEPVGLVHRLVAGGAAVLAVAGPPALAAWPLASAVASGMCLLPGGGWS